MFQQLKKLLEQSKIRSLADHQLGRAVELLKCIYYFRDLVDKFGSDYLLTLFPALQPFIFRQRSTYFNNENDYILIEGDLVEQTLLYRNQIKQGQLLELKEAYQGTFLAVTDCKMILIKRKFLIAKKISKKLMEIQQQKNRNIKEFRRQAQLSQDKANYFKEIKQLRSLGSYDSSQIIAKSQIKDYQSHGKVYSYGQSTNKIGYILAGKVKLVYNEQHSSKFRNDESPKFSINYSQGEWLCLQEYFNEIQSLKNRCYVQSIQAKICWIPLELFSQKITLKLQYELYQKFEKYIALKRILLNKNQFLSIVNNKNKNQRNGFSPRLKTKLYDLQSDEQKKRREYKVDLKQSSHNYEAIDRIVHKDSLLSLIQKMDNLPKINYKSAARVKEYQTFLNNLEFISEMMRKQQKCKEVYTIKKNVLIHSARKINNPQKTANLSLTGMETKNKKTLDDHVKVKLNRSIYNNFKTHSVNKEVKRHKSQMKKLNIYQ